jgi:transposase
VLNQGRWPALGGTTRRLLKKRRRVAARFARNTNQVISKRLAGKAKDTRTGIAREDPRNTSRTCPPCGHRAKRNRPHRDSFLCVACGFAGPADHIAAISIGRRAVSHAADDAA